MAKKASTVNFLAGLSGLVLVYEAPAIFGFQPLTRGVSIAISIAYIIGVAATLYIMRADTKGSIGKFAQDNSEALSRLGVVALVQGCIVLVLVILYSLGFNLFQFSNS